MVDGSDTNNPLSLCTVMRTTHLYSEQLSLYCVVCEATGRRTTKRPLMWKKLWRQHHTLVYIRLSSRPKENFTHDRHAHTCTTQKQYSIVQCADVNGWYSSQIIMYKSGALHLVFIVEKKPHKTTRVIRNSFISFTTRDWPSDKDM